MSGTITTTSSRCLDSIRICMPVPPEEFPRGDFTPRLAPQRISNFCGFPATMALGGTSLVRPRPRALYAVLANAVPKPAPRLMALRIARSEEQTSELQQPMYLVCRLLLEK